MPWPLGQLLWSMQVAQEWGQEQEKEMQTWTLPLPFHPPDDTEKKFLLFKKAEIKIEKSWRLWYSKEMKMRIIIKTKGRVIHYSVRTILGRMIFFLYQLWSYIPIKEMSINFISAKLCCVDWCGALVWCGVVWCILLKRYTGRSNITIKIICS